VADAELVQQVLVGQGGFKKENVLLITDKTERKPALRDLKWASAPSRTLGQEG
jgi:hypothetical protein